MHILLMLAGQTMAKVETGVGIIVNTSFNVRGEPIVCTPQDAHRCFMRTPSAAEGDPLPRPATA